MAHTPKGELPVPTFPDIFDKARLANGEFDKYIYKIPFKIKGGGQKVSKGMTAAGNIHAVHPYLKEIKSELLHYGTVGTRNIMCCVVRVTVTINAKASDFSSNDITVSALADGDVTGVPSADTLVRTTETRALNRALERLLDISKIELNDPSVGIDEEEYGTPLQRPDPNSLTGKMQVKKDKDEAERKRICEAEEEDDDDNQTDASGVPDNKSDSTASEKDSTGTSSDEDW